MPLPTKHAANFAPRCISDGGLREFKAMTSQQAGPLCGDVSLACSLSLVLGKQRIAPTFHSTLSWFLPKLAQVGTSDYNAELTTF